eukprot:TRINITY_DN2891_c2_g1_i2.p1 TRINITY_DN2891_c2_g1~~TRINITY_DN2891_c2_g1_i2.p1  ORF type:complete len:314 (+),score=43.87 TRINITY_DN2891_c2_g1_i2:184-1125(+)
MTVSLTFCLSLNLFYAFLFFSSVRAYLSSKVVVFFIFCRRSQGKCLARSYANEGGVAFLQKFGQQILEIICVHIGQVKEKGMLLVYAVMDLIVQLFPEEGFRLLGDALVKICRLILAGGETQRSIAAACIVLSRICINNPQKLVELSIGVPSGQVSSEQSTFFRLVNLMLDSFDVQSQFDKRKILAIATSNLLTINDTKILEKLSDICAIVTAVCFQISQNGQISGIYPRFVGKDFGDYSMGEGVTQSEDADCELLRWLRVCENDPVQNININVYFQQQWQICHQLHKNSFENMVSKLDMSLSKDVQKMLAQN